MMCLQCSVQTARSIITVCVVLITAAQVLLLLRTVITPTLTLSPATSFIEPNDVSERNIMSPSVAVSTPTTVVKHISPPRVGTLTSEVLIAADPARPTDSSATLLRIRGRGAAGTRGDVLDLCTFEYVIATTNSVQFRFSDATAHAHWTSEFARCWTEAEWWKRPLICRCFHSNFKPLTLAYEYKDATRSTRLFADPFDGAALYHANHVWALHKWVRHHHIAHWTQKLLIFQSTYQHQHLFANMIPPIDGFVFHDTDSQLSTHEWLIFNATVDAALSHTQSSFVQMTQAERLRHMVWATTLEDPAVAASHSPAFRRLSLSPHYGIFSTHPDDTQDFRSHVYERVGIPAPSRCPPKKGVFLYRHNRRVLNQAAIIQMIKETFNYELTAETIDEHTPAEQQVRLFAETGLMLSSHSSQMINVIFSHPYAAMIEVSAEFYNADFSEYAHGMGVYFQYALGGVIPGGVDQPKHRDCVDKLSACDGASHCILEKRFSCDISGREENKQSDFIANETAVKAAVQHAMTHLNWLCNGRFLQDRG